MPETFIILVLLLIAAVVAPLILFRYYVVVAQGYMRRISPYEQSPDNPASKILILGDSTAVGTGADRAEDSVAGRLGREMPRAQIVNKAKNGQRTLGLRQRLPELLQDDYDLIIINIGGNDIIRLVPLEDTKANLRVIVELALACAKRVVLFTTGELGEARMFPWYLRPIMSARSKAVHDMGLELKKQYPDLVYIDLFAAEVESGYRNRYKLYYCPDRLHPSSAGYGMWYDRLKTQLKAPL